MPGLFMRLRNRYVGRYWSFLSYPTRSQEGLLVRWVLRWGSETFAKGLEEYCPTTLHTTHRAWCTHSNWLLIANAVCEPRRPQRKEM